MKNTGFQSLDIIIGSRYFFFIKLIQLNWICKATVLIYLL